MCILFSTFAHVSAWFGVDHADGLILLDVEGQTVHWSDGKQHWCHGLVTSDITNGDTSAVHIRFLVNLC